MDRPINHLRLTLGLPKTHQTPSQSPPKSSSPSASASKSIYRQPLTSLHAQQGRPRSNSCHYFLSENRRRQMLLYDTWRTSLSDGAITDGPSGHAGSSTKDPELNPSEEEYRPRAVSTGAHERSKLKPDSLLTRLAALRRTRKSPTKHTSFCEQVSVHYYDEDGAEENIEDKTALGSSLSSSSRGSATEEGRILKTEGGRGLKTAEGRGFKTEESRVLKIEGGRVLKTDERLQTSKLSSSDGLVSTVQVMDEHGDLAVTDAINGITGLHVSAADTRCQATDGETRLQCMDSEYTQNLPDATNGKHAANDSHGFIDNTNKDHTNAEQTPKPHTDPAANQVFRDLKVQVVTGKSVDEPQDKLRITLKIGKGCIPHKTCVKAMSGGKNLLLIAYKLDDSVRNGKQKFHQFVQKLSLSHEVNPYEIRAFTYNTDNLVIEAPIVQ